MLKEDGRHALGELKQRELFKRIPIVAFTTTEMKMKLAVVMSLESTLIELTQPSLTRPLFLVAKIDFYRLSARRLCDVFYF